jgi:hypothetical protein
MLSFVSLQNIQRNVKLIIIVKKKGKCETRQIPICKDVCLCTRRVVPQQKNMVHDKESAQISYIVE